MSMQISVDPAKLTREQREAVAGFILAYPQALNFQVQTATGEMLDAWASQNNPVVAFGPAETDDTSKSDNAPTPDVAFGGQYDQALPIQMPGIVAAHVAMVQPPLDSHGIQVIGTSVELDKAGLPWDGRIHAESKNKIADGTWRKRRGLDPAVLAKVEAELKAVMGLPAAPVDIKIPSPPSADAEKPPTPPAPPALSDNEMPPIPESLRRAPEPAPIVAAPTTPSAPVVPQAPVAVDSRGQYMALIGRTSAAMGNKKITPEEVAAICTKHGFSGLPLLANRLDLLPQVEADINALIASKG